MLFSLQPRLGCGSKPYILPAGYRSGRVTGSGLAVVGWVQSPGWPVIAVQMHGCHHNPGDLCRSGFSSLESVGLAQVWVTIVSLRSLRGELVKENQVVFYLIDFRAASCGSLLHKSVTHFKHLLPCLQVVRCVDSTRYRLLL